MGATVGSLIDVNQRSYRVTKIENVPGRREQTGTAVFENADRKISKT
jgi:hypothetical protein